MNEGRCVVKILIWPFINDRVRNLFSDVYKKGSLPSILDGVSCWHLWRIRRSFPVIIRDWIGARGWWLTVALPHGVRWYVYWRMVCTDIQMIWPFVCFTTAITGCRCSCTIQTPFKCHSSGAEMPLIIYLNQIIYKDLKSQWVHCSNFRNTLLNIYFLIIYKNSIFFPYSIL